MASRQGPIAAPPGTLVDHIGNATRRGILEGRYPLGSRLDQQALAAEYGASIIPVRESLRQLEAEGLVKIIPRRGAFVAELSLSEVAEIYAIRGVLEQFATELAVSRATDGDLKKLAELARHLERSQDASEWLELNRQWHFELYTLANSPLLMQMIAPLWDRCGLYRHIYPRASSNRRMSNVDHRRILGAARTGDSEAAGLALLAHIRRGSNSVVPSTANALADGHQMARRRPLVADD